MKKAKLPKGISERYGNLYCSFQHPDFGRCREVIAPNGIPLSVTAEHIRAAEKFLAGVKNAIAVAGMGGPAFDYSKFFPTSLRLKRKLITQGMSQTMDTCLAHWLDKKEQARAISTQNGRRLACKEFTERWGAMLVSDLTVAHVKRWIEDSRAKKRSLKTIKNRIGFLSGALATAEEVGLIPFNPVRKINWADIELTRDEKLAAKLRDDVDPFSLDEMRRLLDAAGEYRIMLEAWFGCGMRPNEIFALGWETIDLKAGTCKILWGRVEGNWTGLKNGEKSERTLYLRELPLFAEALKKQKKATFMLKPQDCGITKDRRLVFLNPKTGQPWHSDQEFRKGFWEDLLRRAGVRYRPPYQIRHSFGANAYLMGEPESWIQNVLGHRTLQMVINHYVRKYPRDTADKMGRSGGQKFQQMWDHNGDDEETRNPDIARA